MEAIAGANRGGVAGCSCFRQQSVPSTPASRNVVVAGTFCHLRSRTGGLRTVPQSSFSSAACFQDQGHEQFYRSGQNGGRGKDRLNAVAGPDQGVDADRSFRKAKKMEMKIHKKLKKAACKVAAGASSSSSSSSSSESEAREPTERRGRSSRRVDMERFGREWARISQSPLMSSIPTFSPTFEIIEQPQQIAAPARRIGRDSHNSEVTPSVVVSEELMSRVMAVRMSSVAGASGTAHALLTDPAPVEVCMGGKCKRAGAQDVLAAFQANGVPACAAKCMKKCKLAVNVHLHQDDGHVGQMYSGVGVSDVNALSRRHFGAGAPSRGPGSSSPLISAGQM